jgi:cardiolipin hydrolase
VGSRAVTPLYVQGAGATVAAIMTRDAHGESEARARLRQDVDELLKRSLTDRRLSKAEREQLEGLVAGAAAPEPALAELLAEAAGRVDICVFTITDDRVADQILAAHRRGVAVRIISDDEKAFDEGSDIDRLRHAGVPVRVDSSVHHMHHKFALFDGRRLLTGSYNWTRAAARDNQIPRQRERK